MFNDKGLLYTYNEFMATEKSDKLIAYRELSNYLYVCKAFPEGLCHLIESNAGNKDITNLIHKPFIARLDISASE